MHGVRRADQRKFRFSGRGVERLECRRLLHIDAAPHHDALEELWTETIAEEFPAVPAAEVGGDGSGAVRVAAKLPLTSIPKLSSLPSADATLYLDFDGHFESQWGSYRNVHTPAFDLDGDPLTFTQTELDRIQQIWEYVAEDYAPFRLNVTTVEPPSFADGVGLRVAIGGDGMWSGGKYGGVAYVDSFTNYLPNTVYVFSKNLGAGNARYVADASSHESGHGFGLHHQSRYRGVTKIDEYYKGPGDGRAPLMGNSFKATRSLWWLGTSAVSHRHIQNDMAHIARQANGFGYRPDDHGNSLQRASDLSISGSTATGAGIIEQTTDVDYFAFTTGRGRIHFTVSVAPNVNNLDATLKLLDNQGRVIATADPSNSFNATIAANITRPGKYYVVVGSHGSYGDVGQYTLNGTIVPQRRRDASKPAADSGPLAAATVQFGVSHAPLLGGLLRAVAAGANLSGEVSSRQPSAVDLGGGSAASSASAQGLGLTVGGNLPPQIGEMAITEGKSHAHALLGLPRPLTSGPQAAEAVHAPAVIAASDVVPAMRLLHQKPKPSIQRSGEEQSLELTEALKPDLIDRVFATWWS